MKINPIDIKKTYEIAERAPFGEGTLSTGQAYIFDKDGLMLCDSIEDWAALARLANAGAEGYLTHKRLKEGE